LVGIAAVAFVGGEDIKQGVGHSVPWGEIFFNILKFRYQALRKKNKINLFWEREKVVSLPFLPGGGAQVIQPAL
jgi:hypothetical protein